MKRISFRKRVQVLLGLLVLTRHEVNVDQFVVQVEDGQEQLYTVTVT